MIALLISAPGEHGYQIVEISPTDAPAFRRKWEAKGYQIIAKPLRSVAEFESKPNSPARFTADREA